jgi:hypothetical protein
LTDKLFIRTFLSTPQVNQLNRGQALISTSTPEGRSSLLRASTVRDEEV